MAATSGWMVEAVVPAVGTQLVRRRYLFAVSSEEAKDAERLVRDRIGNLHCTVVARVRLAPRALGQLDLEDGIKELG